MPPYKKQHYIPKTYLKHFATDKFLYVIQLNNKFNTTIQKKGIGDKIFSRNNYYDFPNKMREPYLEKELSRYERFYDQGLKMLEDGELGYETKQLFINWMMSMKIRNTFFREKFAEIIEWIEKTTFGLKHGREAMHERLKEFEDKGASGSKAFQLSRLLEKQEYEGLKKEYSLNFLNRIWSVLRSEEEDFLTSDNPGYSYTFSDHLNRLGFNPVSALYNLNKEVHSAHMFPLSSKLCLALRPIIWDESVSEEKMKLAFLAPIYFEEAQSKLVEEINLMTISTAHNIIIGQQQQHLEQYKEKILERGT